MPQPKVHVPKERVDHVLNGLSILSLLVMFALTVIHYPDLPERIPVHFNALGEPDGFGSKITLWFLVGVSAALYLVLNWAGRNPHLGNYNVPITEENAARQYQNMQRMNRVLTAVICICFAYICFAIIQTALNKVNGLGLWFMLLFIAAIFGVIAYYFRQAKVLG